ncbi:MULTISPECIES: hypothetical protein [unclassified Pseudofrankia]|uniref:hypothetical protein n=1 Tax=unclassified Pseudofrankia TaxID=2994372 RepID=UPI0012FFC686|nr:MULTISPECIES: hypothetical protein [unclassified Pseudofrankia]MDT3438393.1 hypothetical protein [Pseudofrankia sp. BMG5.37]
MNTLRPHGPDNGYARGNNDGRLVMPPERGGVPADRRGATARPVIARLGGAPAWLPGG